MNAMTKNLQQKEFQRMYKEQGINYLGLFGSFAREDATHDSDVDLLINFDNTKTLFELARIKFFFQDILMAIKQNLPPLKKQVMSILNTR